MAALVGESADQAGAVRRVMAPLPLPCAVVGAPVKPASLECLADGLVWLAVKDDLQAVFLGIVDDDAAVKGRARRLVQRRSLQRLDPLLQAADFRAVVRQREGREGLAEV